MKTILLVFLFFCFQIGRAQLLEYFDDGNFTVDPSWNGDTSCWKINAAAQLKSNAQVPGLGFKLYTDVVLSGALTWSIDVQLLFNPSSLNYADIYLLAEDSALTRGYFIRLGNTDDEISLYRRNGNLLQKLIDGENGVLNRSSTQLQLCIERNDSALFSLKRKIAGGSWVQEGVVTDSTFLLGTFTGFRIQQSTASFFNKHLFDNYKIEQMIPDTIPPTIDSSFLVSSDQLDVFFNEEVDTAGLNTANAHLLNSAIGISLIQRDSVLANCLHIRFNQAIPERRYLTLVVQHIRDVSNNLLMYDTVVFFKYKPTTYDVLIDEIMADPSPPQRLPECEWIELHNVCPFPINLSGWYLEKENDRSGSFSRSMLLPDSSIILCSTGSYDTLRQWTKCLAVSSFPALTNSGDLLVLKSEDQQTIHRVRYSSDWYKNIVKQNGGWSLEMIDLNNPCEGIDNWAASTEAAGGTPGRLNSIDAVNPDIKSPKILHAFPIDSMHIILSFNEPLDSISAALPTRYQVSDPTILVEQVLTKGPEFNQVEVVLSAPLQHGKIYLLTVKGMTDCMGNPIIGEEKVRVGLYQVAYANDVVINELLFNPRYNGVDYIELYNRSHKIINLQSLLLANHNSLGQLNNPVSVVEHGRLFFPDDYIVLTSGMYETMRDYFVSNPNQLIPMKDMPSMNDDEGYLVVLDQTGKTIDECTYNAKQHTEFLEQIEGVALERINPNITSSETTNWHSASYSSGYGTPTSKNSQSKPDMDANDAIAIEPALISPNNDGVDDVVQIRYRFNHPGTVLSVSLYDLRGRLLGKPISGALCGSSGAFFWNGVAGVAPLQSGLYVLLIEGFGRNGEKIKVKKPVAIRMN